MPHKPREGEQAQRLREALELTERSFRQAFYGMAALKAALGKLKAAMEPPLAVKSKGRGR